MTNVSEQLGICIVCGSKYEPMFGAHCVLPTRATRTPATPNGHKANVSIRAGISVYL
jgi:hypothetical protein